LEILVPSPRRIVDAVVRVVFANRNFAVGNDHEYFNTGLQFVFIDERDRDSIINHISNVQLKRNRQLREQYSHRTVLDTDDLEYGTPATGINWADMGRNMLLAAVLCAVVFILINYFKGYATDHPKNEIGEAFENALKRYIEKQK
jgi:hypothetical protein